MKFYNRETEMEALKGIERKSQDYAQMTVITGRRRIGKTALIRHSFGRIPFLYFFVARKSEALLCEELSGIVREVLHEDLGDFSSFARLFGAMMNLSKRMNFTLVLDEFQNFKYSSVPGQSLLTKENRAAILTLYRRRCQQKKRTAAPMVSRIMLPEQQNMKAATHLGGCARRTPTISTARGSSGLSAGSTTTVSFVLMLRVPLSI